MQFQEKKLELIQQILLVHDQDLLNGIGHLLENGLDYSLNDIEKSWQSLAEEDRAGIETAIAQLDNGEGIPHEVVMAEVYKHKIELLRFRDNRRDPATLKF